MSQVLIVDDQRHVLEALSLLFELHGIDTCVAQSPQKALRALEEESIGLVLQDMNFSRATTTGEEGVELFRAIRKQFPQIPVLLMTAWASLKTAVMLVKEGADDYIEKPWNDQDLVRQAQNLLRAHQRDSIASTLPIIDDCGLVHQDAKMRALVRLSVKAARSSLSILVTGENGSGKEKIAEIIHRNSDRRENDFVKVNAGALPDSLLSAELFGAEAGAYTGAKSRRIGRFEEADGGTLFLDEIGNLSLDGQAKLLRALESGEFERLGEGRTRKVNVRVVAATNASVSAAIAEGRFREDLYYRLSGIEFNVPPLRDRREDILPLARHFLEQAPEAEKAKRSGCSLSICPEAESGLLSWNWPGNVRELKNRVLRAAVFCESGAISLQDLGLLQADNTPSQQAQELGKTSLDDAERETLRRALDESDQVVADAAKKLGITRQALYRRLQRLGMQKKH